MTQDLNELIKEKHDLIRAKASDMISLADFAKRNNELERKIQEKTQQKLEQMKVLVPKRHALQDQVTRVMHDKNRYTTKKALQEARAIYKEHCKGMLEMRKVKAQLRELLKDEQKL